MCISLKERLKNAQILLDKRKNIVDENRRRVNDLKDESDMCNKHISNNSDKVNTYGNDAEKEEETNKMKERC